MSVEASARPADASARCAQHPDAPAEATCARCGDFACEECVHRPGDLGTICASCIDKAREARSAMHRTERGLRNTAGTLYLIGIVWLLAAATSPVTIPDPEPDPDTPFIVLTITALLTVFGAATMVSARLLDRFRPAGRIMGFIAATLTLALFPLGTVLGAFALVGLVRHGRATKPDHRGVVALTPEMSAKRMPGWLIVLITGGLLGTLWALGWMGL